MRNACDDFVEIVKRNRSKFRNGVVHSFTGSSDELRALLQLDLYIGINGCSLKTAENLKVIAEIPNDRLMIETDAPWCDIRNTHAGAKFVKTHWPQKDKKKHEKGKWVKGRNEPCAIRQVMEVVAGVKGEDLNGLAHQIYNNTQQVFFPHSQ
jgi:TatD DNase family protein